MSQKKRKTYATINVYVVHRDTYISYYVEKSVKDDLKVLIRGFESKFSKMS